MPSIGDLGLGMLSRGRSPRVPDNLLPMIKRLEPFVDTWALHHVDTAVFETPGHPKFSKGQLIETLYESSQSDAARIAGREEGFRELELALADAGVIAKTGNKRALISETRQSIGGDTSWTVVEELLETNDPNVSVKVEAIRTDNPTAAVPPGWQATRSDVTLEPANVEAQFRFDDNKYMLVARIGASLKAIARNCEDVARTILRSERAVKPALLTAALTNVKGNWAFVGNSADMLNGTAPGLASKLHIAVSSSSWDRALDALQQIATKHKDFDREQNPIEIRTTAGTVEIERVPNDLFSQLNLRTVGSQEMPVGPGLSPEPVIDVRDSVMHDFGIRPRL